MKSETELKNLVKEKYAEIANLPMEQNLKSCCGATTSGCGDVYNVMADNYATLEGYVADADLGLGCGIPTEFANIKEGDTVLDLGSGAGNDAFVARNIVGQRGRVIGIDFTEPMINKARENADKLGINNVEFRLGDIEKMPLGPKLIDVVISNCVLNLVPNKVNVIKEIFRVLKPGGHFCISDIVLDGELPESIKKVAEMYAGCVSGAIQRSEYLNIIEAQSFEEITVHKQKEIIIPDDILSSYLSPEEITEFKSKQVGIYSVTVSAKKAKDCCTPGSGCC